MSECIINVIMDKVAKCKDCILKDKGRAFYKGNTSPKVAIIGESPGESEIEVGVPFVGPSGEVLHEWIRNSNSGLEESIYFTNRVKCWPKVSGYQWGNYEQAIEAKCDRFIDEELSILQPKFIITVGAVAFRYLFPEESSILKNNGRVVVTNFGYGDVQVLSIVHPAFILRQEDKELLNQYYTGCRESISKFLQNVW